MEMNYEIFKNASRKKYRFPYHGSLTVEDLWDLNESDLDKIFKSLNTQVKKENEESLFESQTSKDTELEEKIAIVRYIFFTKREEKTAHLANQKKKQEKEKILAILAKKKEDSLEAKSEEELLAMLENL